MDYMVQGTASCHASVLANIDVNLGFIPSAVTVYNPKSGVKLEWNSSMANASAFKRCLTNDGLVISPELAIGSTPANVASKAFAFRVANVVYSKAAVAAGTAPSATTIPQNKYGLFCWEIGTDGTIDKTEAAGNAVGYATEALAIAAAPAASASHIRLGYITVMSTDGGGFVGATTSLAAAAVTAKYYNYDTVSNPLTLGITPIDSTISDSVRGFRIGIDTDLQILGNTLYYRAWR